MTKRDFRPAISEARSLLERVGMPPASANRVRRGVGERLGRLRRTQLALFGLTAAVAVALLLAWNHRPTPHEIHAGLPGGFETLSRSADLQLSVDRPGAALHVGKGTCTLRVRGWGRVSLGAGTWLREVDGGLDLGLGTADFQVDKRAPGAGSTFVRGPQGTIEITGTRFSVIQRADGGSVRLDEGRITFHAPDGRTVALAPGQSLSWPLPERVAPVATSISASAPASRPAPAGPAPRIASPVRQARSVALEAREKPAPAAAGDMQTLVERIAVLREKGQYRELVEELGVAVDKEQRPLTRERLMFELGSVLTYHLGGARACAHWDNYRRAFPAGHYADEVSDARKFLHCNNVNNDDGGAR